jgi:16S rRNA (cytosine967-C5)-methyltransferase
LTDTRRLAIELLRRIDEDGAYANLVVPPALARSGLDERDRAFVTEVVYGATRMRRACDFLVDRFLVRRVEPSVRAALRAGAYQLHFMRTPPHAAVDATVTAVGGPGRGLVNAVLRRVAAAPVEWPDEPTRLSYPDWIVDRLTAELGAADARAALAKMNEPAAVDERADGYVQDRSSQWVAELVEARRGDLVADLCAAPGGKATALAEAGAIVVAGDLSRRRAGLVAANVERLGLTATVHVLAADGRHPPLAAAGVDRVLLDAPCSGLGSLRRRPDARWRIRPEAVPRLARLQRGLIDGAVPLLRPGGVLVYSVCTMTVAESIGIDDFVAGRWPDLVPLAPPPAPWRPWGRGSMVLPQDAGTDAMVLFRYRAP